MEEPRQEAAAELSPPDAQRYLENWRRAQADLENYKKRVEQERSESARFAGMPLIINILPVLDDLDRALMAIPEKLAHLSWTEGIRLIRRKLQAILEAQGVSEVKALGRTFDPSVHEAVGQAAGEEGQVVDEAQKGYTLHGRLIRPSFVVVGNGQAHDKKNAPEPSQDSHDTGG